MENAPRASFSQRCLMISRNRVASSRLGLVEVAKRDEWPRVASQFLLEPAQFGLSEV
jgi:hypothetical protein